MCSYLSAAVYQLQYCICGTESLSVDILVSVYNLCEMRFYFGYNNLLQLFAEEE